MEWVDLWGIITHFLSTERFLMSYSQQRSQNFFCGAYLKLFSGRQNLWGFGIYFLRKTSKLIEISVKEGVLTPKLYVTIERSTFGGNQTYVLIKQGYRYPVCFLTTRLQRLNSHNDRFIFIWVETPDSTLIHNTIAKKILWMEKNWDLLRFFSQKPIEN